jgi:hypothetical protein
VLFDGPRSQLPTATLLASGSHTRRRVDIDRWLSLRWDWVRPRAVPLLAAFVGLLLTLGAVKYTSLLSYDHDQVLQPRSARSAQPARMAPSASSERRAGRLPPVYQGLACRGPECMVGCPRRATH